MSSLTYIPQKCTFFESFYHLVHEGYDSNGSSSVAKNDAELGLCS